MPTRHGGMPSITMSRARAAAMPTILQIKVKPGARVSSLTRCEDGTWSAQIKSPPVDGQANAELVALVAKHFQCAKSAVRIKTGASGRHKLGEVTTG